MIYLTLEQVIEIHDLMISLEGGLEGIRSDSLLHSCIELPKMSCFGIELYPEIYDKAAAYLYFLIQNHPFNDANKRTATTCFLVFLDLNGFDFTMTDQEILKLVLSIANGEIKIDEISKILKKSQS